MLKVKVIKTNSNESDLLFQLVSCGKHAEIPCYFSVERYDLEKGFVVFIRLDYDPAPMFRVWVAGKNILVPLKFEEQVKDWLVNWDIYFEEKNILEAITPADINLIAMSMQNETMYRSKRKKVIEDLEEKIKAHKEKEYNARFGQVNAI